MHHISGPGLAVFNFQMTVPISSPQCQLKRRLLRYFCCLDCRWKLDDWTTASESDCPPSSGRLGVIACIQEVSSELIVVTNVDESMHAHASFAIHTSQPTPPAAPNGGWGGWGAGDVELQRQPPPEASSRSNGGDAACKLPVPALICTTRRRRQLIDIPSGVTLHVRTHARTQEVCTHSRMRAHCGRTHAVTTVHLVRQPNERRFL